MRLIGLFKPKAESEYTLSWNSLKDSITRHVQEQRQRYMVKNSGSLKHRFYNKVHSLFSNDEKASQNARDHALRSDAYYALELIGNRQFRTNLDLEQFLEEHSGFVQSSSHGISLKEIADYVIDHEDDLKNDEYLALMR